MFTTLPAIPASSCRAIHTDAAIMFAPPQSSLNAARSTPTAAISNVLTTADNDRAMRTRIEELAKETARPDWDSDGGMAIPLSEWTRAMHLFTKASMLVSKMARPFISPCGDGTIHIEWLKPDRKRLIIELYGSAICWSLRRPDGTYSNGICSSDGEALRLINTHVS